MTGPPSPRGRTGRPGLSPLTEPVVRGKPERRPPVHPLSEPAAVQAARWPSVAVPPGSPDRVPWFRWGPVRLRGWSLRWGPVRPRDWWLRWSWTAPWPRRLGTVSRVPGTSSLRAWRSSRPPCRIHRGLGPAPPVRNPAGTGRAGPGGRNAVVGVAGREPCDPGAGMCAFGGSRGSDRSIVIRAVAGGRASTGPSRGSVAVEVADSGAVDSVKAVGEVDTVVAVDVGVVDSRAVVAKVGAGAVDRQTPSPTAQARRHPMTMKTRILPVSRFIASPRSTVAGTVVPRLVPRRTRWFFGAA